QTACRGTTSSLRRSPGSEHSRMNMPPGSRVKGSSAAAGTAITSATTWARMARHMTGTPGSVLTDFAGKQGLFGSSSLLLSSARRAVSVSPGRRPGEKGPCVSTLKGSLNKPCAGTALSGPGQPGTRSPGLRPGLTETALRAEDTGSVVEQERRVVDQRPDEVLRADDPRVGRRHVRRLGRQPLVLPVLRQVHLPQLRLRRR